MKRRLALVFGGLVLLAGIVALSVRGRGARDTVKLFAEEAAQREITQTVRATGQIQPKVQVNISAHVVGKIERLFVAEGDDLEAGRPFLQLEQEAFLAARDNARAQLAMNGTELRQSEVALADQEIKVERARKLSSDGITSGEALETAELQYTSARLRVEQAREAIKQAQAMLDRAEDDLRKTTIYAPIAGRVITLNAKEGEVVVSGTMNNPASVIGTIADLSEVLAEIDVDETEVVHVAVGQTAEVRVDALPDAEYAARVEEIGSSGYSKASQPDVTFFRVKLLLAAPDQRLRPGMSTRAEIAVASHQDAIVVPIQSVLERRLEGEGDEPGSEAKVVFVVSEGKAHRRVVRTGLSDSTHVELLEGLQAGDLVATGPYRALRRVEDGDRVRVTKPELLENDAEKREEESD